MGGGTMISTTDTAGTAAETLPFFLIEGPVGSTMTVWTAAAAAILRAHPWRTEDPTAANLFFTTLETAGETNWPVYGRQSAAFLGGGMRYFRDKVFDRIAALPFQGETNRHVIFNLNPYSGYLDKFADRRNFIFPSSSIAAADYRRFRDISFPVNPILDLAAGDARSARPEYFLTFRGADSHPVRRRLADLHNDRDVIVELLDMRSRAHLGEAHAGATLAHDEIKRYAELMCNTAFALVPRGDALFSYRLTEALAAGAIPVIVSDGWVLPFEDVLDYRAFSVVIPEARCGDTLDILRRLPEADIARMRTAAGNAYRAQFATMSRQINTLLAILHGWRRDGRWADGDDGANPDSELIRSTADFLNRRTREFDDLAVARRHLAMDAGERPKPSSASSPSKIVGKVGLRKIRK